MYTACVFCERKPLEPRVFYDRFSWYAFLAAPPYAKGHTILAVKNSGTNCPTTLQHEHLKGLDVALADVVQTLLQHYRPKDVLFASLRGKDPHVHCHLVPLWQEQEREWRVQSLHEKGHLFEFLGYTEKTAQSKAQHEKIERGWSEEDQLLELKPDVDALRVIAGYALA
jgi:diadenosine tetraphosphate (Ap4A) HIT family hydrolase